MIITADIIQRVYNFDKNAFLLGCGKDTMMYKFYEVTGILFDKTDVRKSLKYHCMEYKETNHCTRYIPHFLSLERGY